MPMRSGPLRYSNQNVSSMFKNYFKIAWRNALKQKLYSLINTFGLATGITCFILIGLYVGYEFSFDKEVPNKENIYRVIQHQKGNMFLGTDYFAVMPAPAAKTLKSEFPEVVEAAAFQPLSAIIGIDVQNSSSEMGYWAEPSFFTVFKPDFLYGNPNLVFDKSNGIVITRLLSIKVFGRANSLGELLKLDNQDFEVTGILEDLPQNSSLKYDFVRNIADQPNYKKQSWSNNAPFVFIQLANNTDPRALEAKLPSFLAKHQKLEGYPFENILYLEPLTEIYFNTNVNMDFATKGNANLLFVLGLIAVIVLLLACINYMNLSLARSVKRTTEVGLRKVVGAGRYQILLQFLGEAVFFSFFAVLVALVASLILLPLFRDLIERPLSFMVFDNPVYLFGLAGLILLVAFVSGSYPALVISRLRPGPILKGGSFKTAKGLTLQKILIISQYACSFILIIGGIVMYRQMQFIHSKDVGYTREHILTIPINNDRLRGNLETLKNQWLSSSGIREISFANQLPINVKSSSLLNYEEGVNTGIAVYEAYADFNYIDIFDLEVISGRKLSEDYAQDKESTEEKEGNFVLNEAAIKALGYTPEESIGKTFTYYKGWLGTIVGVVKDFNIHSLHSEILPLRIGHRPYYTNIVVKISPQNIRGTLKYMESGIAEFSDSPFYYSFLDEQFNQLYKAEQKLGKAINYFSFVALLLASFGLFGLAAIITEQRFKEVGIRKVLGASEKKIISLLTSDFLLTVLIAFALAIPLSWYFMDQWLESYAYRIKIGVGIYILTGSAALIITFITVSYQAMRAALANPVKSLRTE